MKPLYLKLAAFGPYKDCQEIDFEKLWEKGLFLICGETGSGKTMILDAITFALYGKSSGNMRDELEALRCRQSDWGQDTFVQFTFSVQGVCYRFERRLECKRKNLTTTQNAYRRNEEGVFEPLFENCKKGDMDALARELIGLDYDQFRQVIILPQGQFERLLTSGSEEKEKILMRIFGVDKWQKLADYFYKHAEERLNELKQLREKLLHSLTEEECSTMEEFRQQIADLERAIAHEEAAYQQADYEGKRGALEQERERGKAFQQLRNLQAAVDKIKEQEGLQQARLEKRGLAERAEGLRQFFERLENLEREKKQREQQVQASEEKLEQAISGLEQVRQQIVVLEARREEMEQLTQELPLNRQKRSSYEGLNAIQSELDRQKKQLEIAGKEVEQKKQALDGCEKKSKKLREDFERLSGEHRRLLEAYMINIAGILAQDLQDGQPCPVCGSTSHPAKAILGIQQVSKEMVEERKGQADTTYEALSQALDAVTQAQADYNRQEQSCAQLGFAMKALEQELTGIREQLIPGVEDLASYEKWLAELEKQLRDYEISRNQLQQSLKLQEEALAVSRNNWDNAQRELGSVQKQLQEQRELLEQQLQVQGFATEAQAREALLSSQEIAQLGREIEKYTASKELSEKQLKEAKQALEGKEEPDLQTCEQALQELEIQREAYIACREKARANLERKQAKAKRLTRDHEALEQQWSRAETDWAFAKYLRGDTGTGLQRYVLGILFSSVIVAANRMLEQVHGGRYRLYRSDERTKGSNKRGLELKVYDSFSSEHEGRSVKTLSGGEKFLVSLALSIGMSTVAQKSGIRIEAMFIDEGFGSLDQNSIEDALGILTDIQKANGMVGIISHVQLLQAHIPTKLQITKSRDGSKIVSNIG